MDVSLSLTRILSAFISFAIYSYFSLPFAFLSNPRLVTIRLCICVCRARQPSELSRIDSRADVLFRRCISQDARHQKSWGDAFMSMERVCVYVLPPEIKVPVRVCVCVWAERKKTNRVMERSSGWWKRGHVLWFQETDKNLVFISQMWTCTIMSNYLGLAVNVSGCIPICNSIESARWGLERPKS